MGKNAIKYFFSVILLLIVVVNFLNGRIINNPQIILVTNISLVLAALFFIGLRFSKRTNK
jgi:uncharacterized membrane protein